MRFIIPFLLLMTCILVTNAFAELPPVAKITGTVTDEMGEAIPYPSVIAVAGNDTLGAYMSHSDGRYRIEFLEPTASAIEELSVPQPIRLHQNFPNPFNPSTMIPFELDHACEVILTLYSVTGQRIATLFDGYASPGMHRIAWNGRDDSGNSVGSGLYFYRLAAGEHREVRKMLLLDSGAGTSGGAPTASRNQVLSEHAAKPASTICDIIVSKPGYETKRLPGVIVPDGIETIKTFTLTPDLSNIMRLPVELDTVWEYIETDDDIRYVPPGGLYERNITQVTGTAMVDTVLFYQLDSWPVFIPSAFHDPGQIPLLREGTEGDVWFRYNEQDILIIPSSEQTGLVQKIHLVNGNELTFGWEDTGAFSFRPSFGTIFGSNPDCYFLEMKMMEYDPVEEELVMDWQCSYACDLQGWPVLYHEHKHSLQPSGDILTTREFHLKRMTSGDHTIGLPMNITPNDGIQSQDISYFLKRMIDPADVFTVVPVLTCPLRLETVGIDDLDLIPVLPYLRFQYTTFDEDQQHANTSDEVVSIMRLTLAPEEADTVTVMLEYGFIEPNDFSELRQHLYEGSVIKFIPGDDMWFCEQSWYIAN